MDAVWVSVPKDERKRKASRPENELFSLGIKIFDQHGQPVLIPLELEITDGSWVSRFAHRPNLIDSIRDYLFLPVQVPKELNRKPPAEEIHMVANSMLEYVETKTRNTSIIVMAIKDGRAFHKGFCQLRDLMKWAMENNHQVEADVRYEYTGTHTGERRILRVPEEVEQ